MGGWGGGGWGGVEVGGYPARNFTCSEEPMIYSSLASEKYPVGGLAPSSRF